MKDLLESGVHFGHQTRRWDPKMAPYIFTERNGIHIIDLLKTLNKLNEAADAMAALVREGGYVLFVGTKKQAQASIREAARSCGMFYVTNRWLGGTLTNFETIKKSINRLHRLERMEADGTTYQITKKERLVLSREREKLEKNVGGIKNMKRLPDALCVVDPRREAIAVAEAHKMKIPIFAIVDTNCDPTLIDHVVPGNDDAIRAIKLFSSVFKQSVLEGAEEAGRMLENADGEYVEGSASFSAGSDNFADDSEESVPSPFEKDADKKLSSDSHIKYDEKYGDDLATSEAGAAEEVKEEPKEELKEELKNEVKEEGKIMRISAADVKALRDKTAAGMMDCKEALTEAGGDMAAAEKILKEKGLSDAAGRMHRETREGVVAIQENESAVVVAEVHCETDFVARNDVFQNFADQVAQYVLEESRAIQGADDFSTEFTETFKGTIATLGENISIGRIVKIARRDRHVISTYIHGGGKIGVAVDFELSDGAAGDRDEFKTYARDVAMQVASMNPLALDRDAVPQSVVEEQKEILRKQAAETGKPADIIEKMLTGQIDKFFKEITLVDQTFVKDNKKTIARLTEEVGEAVGVTIKIIGYTRFKVGEVVG